MSIYDFYSSLTSGERTPLFQALYKLSRLQDLRAALDGPVEQEMRDWSIWNNPGTVHQPTEPPEPVEPVPFALARA